MGDTPQRFGFWKSVLFALVICLTFLGGLEGALRALGYESSAMDPYEAFVRHRPLFELRDGFHRTRKSRTRFFHAQSFAAAKEPASFRFFVVGGSMAYGYELQDPARGSFVHRLESLLRQREPSRRIEGVNVGGISYASYRLVGLVEEVLDYEPDLIVVATGHNEFLEARHYADLVDHASWLDRVLYEVRIAHLLRDLLETAQARFARSVRPAAPSDPVLQAEYVGERYIVRDAREYRLTLDHFTRNLERIIDLARARGIPVMLMTLPSNLRDWPPFHTVTPNDAAKQVMERDLNLGVAHLKARRFRAALALARSAIAANERAAVFHYLAARSLDGLGDHAAAKRHYVLAKDTDGFPHRALSDFNERVREIAAERDVILVDGEAVFERAARDGIPGNDLFLDHCHPNARGHRLLAEAIAAHVAADLP